MLKVLTWLLGLCLIMFNSMIYAFDTYGFIPWSLKQDNKIINGKEKVNSALSKKGIKEIDVVYHNRMLTNGYVDHQKIKKIADQSKLHPYTPISFDIEIGNRNKPETILPTVIAVIDLYRAYGGKAPVGVYALLPQNTYGSGKLNENKKKTFIELNKQYEILAKKVDFISPVFYFYDGKNMDAWKKSVDFNMEESLKFAKKYNLKIYPYITNSFRVSNKNPKTKGWTIDLLNKTQMVNTLDYLESKGADGAIIWASSQVVDKSGIKPVIEFNQPWIKGVEEFKKSN